MANSEGYFTVLRIGAEIQIYLVGETGRAVLLGAGLTLPDAKLAARGTIIKRQYALDRLGMADVKAEETS